MNNDIVVVSVDLGVAPSALGAVTLVTLDPNEHHAAAAWAAHWVELERPDVAFQVYSLWSELYSARKTIIPVATVQELADRMRNGSYESQVRLTWAERRMLAHALNEAPHVDAAPDHLAESVRSAVCDRLLDARMDGHGIVNVDLTHGVSVV